MTSLADPTSAGSPHLPRLLSGTEREAAMERLSVEFAALSSSKRAFLRAAWILRRQGVLVVRHVVPPEPLKAINAEVNQLLAQLDAGKTKQLASKAILNLPNKRRIKGYENFVDAEQAVINHRVNSPDGRSGSDAGMVDIFHPERLSEAMAEWVTTCLHECLISRLLLASSLLPMRVKCRNLYINLSLIHI